MIIVLDKQNEREALRLAKEKFRNGEVMIVPFDTVYGFICNPFDDKAIKKVYSLKNRPISKTIGLAFDKLSMASKFIRIDKPKLNFIKNHTPGPYTFILPSKSKKLSSHCLQNETCAIRFPKTDFIIKLLRVCGGIVAQTSANKSAESSCFSLEQVLNQFKASELDDLLVIDMGPIKSPGPSQLIDLSGSSPRMIER